MSPGRQRCSKECSDTAHRLSEQARGADEHDHQQEHIRHEVGPGGVIGLHQHRAQPEHQAADDGAQRVAQRADDDDGERGGGEAVAQIGRNRAEQVGQKHPGDTGERQPGHESQRRDLVHVDAGRQRFFAAGHDGAGGVAQPGAGEIQPQRHDGGNAHSGSPPPAVRKLLPKYPKIARAQRLAGQRALIGAEAQSGECFEHLPHAEKQNERQHFRVAAALQSGYHGVIERIADDDGGHDHRRHAPQRVETEVARHQPGGIRAQHDELPMRQIDDAHDAKDQVQSDADQAEINAIQNAADDGVFKQFHAPSLSCFWWISRMKRRTGRTCRAALSPALSRLRLGRGIHRFAGRLVLRIDHDHVELAVLGL